MLVPAVADYVGHGQLAPVGIAVVSLAVLLLMVGALLFKAGFPRRHEAALPMAVRAAITGNVLFLSFCALEFSDGLIRQDGRVFYWTSVLFLPALCQLYGLVSAHRWAWWLARGVTALFTLWFLCFLVIIPFADMRTNGVIVPWWGRTYMICFTLLLASVAFTAFRALGSAEARGFFGLPLKQPVARSA
jgi:hypothetical protein